MGLLSDVARITCLVFGSCTSGIWFICHKYLRNMRTRSSEHQPWSSLLCRAYTLLYTSTDNILSNQPWADSIETLITPLSLPSGYNYWWYLFEKRQKKRTSLAFPWTWRQLKRLRTGPYSYTQPKCLPHLRICPRPNSMSLSCIRDSYWFNI